MRVMAVGAHPVLRMGGEVLSPTGSFQERVFCCLAPLVYLGEPFLDRVWELARTHVRECLEGQVHHYITSADFP